MQQFRLSFIIDRKERREFGWTGRVRTLGAKSLRQKLALIGPSLHPFLTSVCLAGKIIALERSIVLPGTWLYLSQERFKQSNRLVYLFTMYI
jgi:hypothetical protein